MEQNRKARPVYRTSGSAALQPDYEIEVDEPLRVRTAAERAEADRRSAERIANRAAGRADVESRRRLRVAPPLPVTVARAPFIAMLCAVVVAGVVGILVLTAKINANQFRLDNLQSQQAGLDQQEQQLQEAIAVQQAPGNLVAAAKKLGLVPAGALAYITLPNGKVYGLPQPASTATSVTAQTGTASSATTAPSANATPSSAPSAGTSPAATLPSGGLPTGPAPNSAPTGTASTEPNSSTAGKAAG